MSVNQSNSPVFNKAFNYLAGIIEDDYINYKTKGTAKRLTAKQFYLLGARSTGKTYSILSMIIVYASIMPIKAYIFRQYTKDVHTGIWTQFKDLVNKVYGTTNNVGYWTFNESRTIAYFRCRDIRSIVYFKGLKTTRTDTVKITGISDSYNRALTIAFFEEAHEYSEKDIKDVKEAIIRGKNNTRIFYASNPWSLDHYIIKYCNDKFPFSQSILEKAPYEQMKQLGEEFFHYTCAEVNEQNSIDTLNMLRETYRLDPFRGRVSYLGMYGLEQGGIYSDYFQKIGKPIISTNYIIMVGGVDWGERHDASSAVLIGIDINYSQMDVLDEYYWSNKGVINPKDSDIMAGEIISFFRRQLEPYSYIRQYGLTIYVDSSAISFITILNRKAEVLGYPRLFFKPCFKWPIVIRIDYELALMSGNQLTISDKCVNLKRELQASIYKEKLNINRTGEISSSPREDGNDDVINAWEYTIPAIYGKLRLRNNYLIKHAEFFKKK